MASRTDRLRSLLKRQAEELASFEREAVGRAGALYRARLGEMAQEIVRRWVLIAGGLEAVPTPGQAARLVEMMVEVVGRVATVPVPDLAAVAREAVRMGLRHGGEQAGQAPDLFDPDLAPGDLGRLPEDIAERLEALPDRLARQLATAAGLARRLPPEPDTRDRVLAAAGRVRTIVEAETEILAVRGASVGISRVARQARLSTVWVPERDACLHCLAYAGKVSDGTGFPPGLTFGDHPVLWAVQSGRVPAPPLHPRCRCQLTVWSASWTSQEISLPEALEREARRSVALGFALPSESEAARRRAADRLLESGAGLPRTVEERARRRIRDRRRFTRPVP